MQQFAGPLARPLRPTGAHREPNRRRYRSAGISLFNESILAERGFAKEIFLNITVLGIPVGLASNLLCGWLATRWQLSRLLALAMAVLGLTLLVFPRVEGETPDAVALVAMQERLERAGIRSQREEGVECCYARQTKFWVHDPERTLWEIYTLEADIEHRGAGQVPEAVLPPGLANSRDEPVVWEHRLGEPVPAAVPLADGSADEVHLRGSFNVPLPTPIRERLVGEAWRVLKPGGRLFIHVLVADRPLTNPPRLPGPAAAVRHVPLQSEPVALLQRAGFQGIELAKFDAKPCFQEQGAALRELQLEGWKASNPGGEAVSALYKGPGREVADDLGNVYPRGEWVRVAAAAADRLRTGPGTGAFVFAG